MKIDFNKLRQLEVEYASLSNMPGISVSNEISLETLDVMMDIILRYENPDYSKGPANVQLAYNTLKDLGILIDDSEKVKPGFQKPQQLNS